MPGRLDFTLKFAKTDQHKRPNPGGPMRILVLGDFSGRDRRAEDVHLDLTQRPILAVDIDNFDTVLARVAPGLNLVGVGLEAPVELAFQTLEDFHPDALARQVAPLAQLLDARTRLSHSSTFAQAAAELPALARAAAPVPPTATTSEADADTLARLLGEKPHPSTPAAAKAQGVLDGFLRQIVTPAAGAPPGQAAYLATVEEALSKLLRALLHHPDFQALEATWRGLYGLVSELGGGDGDVHIHLCDVTRAELDTDLARAENDPYRTGLARRLATDDLSWSCLVGNFTFGGGNDNLALLAALGAIAAQAGAPFLAAAEPALLGCQSLESLRDSSQWPVPEAGAHARWQALRRSPTAAWIGLALPRSLLRLPYGPRQERVDAFPFLELPTGVVHEHLLWGNPAMGLALLLGKSFLASAWDMSSNDTLQLDDLPALVHEVDGERRLYPCAEAWLGERTAEAMLERGLMPLVSRRDRNAAHLPRFQSIAEPLTALAAPWRD